MTSAGDTTARGAARRPVTGSRALAPEAFYPLALGDDALVLAQRFGEWIARAPQLEEDVALANIGLDLLGQARALLTLAGAREGEGRHEDDLAYLREERDFVNVRLVEIDNGDFAVTILRLLWFSAYQLPLYRRLAEGTDTDLAGIAAKAVKEVTYHLDHAAQWVVRLGDGTSESHDKCVAALEVVDRFTDELFDGSWVDASMVAAGAAVDPAQLRAEWETTVDAVLTEANLARPGVRQDVGGGRAGMHTTVFGHVLAEMQHLHRSHPDATW